MKTTLNKREGRSPSLNPWLRSELLAKLGRGCPGRGRGAGPGLGSQAGHHCGPRFPFLSCLRGCLLGLVPLGWLLRPWTMTCPASCPERRALGILSLPVFRPAVPKLSERLPLLQMQALGTVPPALPSLHHGVCVGMCPGPAAGDFSWPRAAESWVSGTRAVAVPHRGVTLLRGRTVEAAPVVGPWAGDWESLLPEQADTASCRPPGHLRVLAPGTYLLPVLQWHYHYHSNIVPTPLHPLYVSK